MGRQGPTLDYQAHQKAINDKNLRHCKRFIENEDFTNNYSNTRFVIEVSFTSK